MTVELGALIAAVIVVIWQELKALRVSRGL